MAQKKKPYQRPRDRERKRFKEFCQKHGMVTPRKWAGPTMTIRNFEEFETWHNAASPYPHAD